jgi:hypothetical protein
LSLSKQETELTKIRKLLQLLVDLQYRARDGAEHDEKKKDVTA